MKKARIILIEDDRDIRETFQACLESDGYLVESFVNGRAAIERLQHDSEVCLILLDMMMPIMDGAEFMESFTRLPVTIVPIPVYLCSASANAVEANGLGCRGFIKKPVDLDLLLGIVGRYCQISTRDAAA